MAFNATARSASQARDDVAELPLWRLHLMRVDTSMWTLASRREMAGGRYDRSMPLFKGVVAVLLTAMSLLAFLELRYPVRLLPILLFECAWKLIRLAVVAVLAVAARMSTRPRKK